jgi:uncharacterized protein
MTRTLRRPLPLSDVTVDDDFWAPRRETVRTVTLDHQYRQLVETGRLDALRLTWKPGDEPVPHIFWDSDVAKWIEAASYFLATQPDPDLEARVEGAVELLAGAQQPDGYLNTYFTVVRPGRRFTDLRDAHELYCAGHLIEAAVAHVEATGRKTLLAVATRYADLIGRVFGTGEGQLPGYDGHEEIELALVKLARVTGQRRYLELAKYFIDQRGTEPYFFAAEARRRGDAGYFADHFPERDRDEVTAREYLQAHRPVRDQDVAVGHSVRAMYLYSAMADLAAATGDEELMAACRRLWRSVTQRRMYLTGGIGSSAHNEGWTEDYDLPNETAYAETCAAIGLVFWGSRMAAVEQQGHYADIVERALFNGVLSGISHTGTEFFYDNPLASDGRVHRKPWFGVACCPPNLARLIGSLGAYVYSRTDTELVVDQYVGGSARFEVGGTAVTVRQRSDYPWDGRVSLTVQPAGEVDFDLLLRIPGWAGDVTVLVAGTPWTAGPQDGYVRIGRRWRPGDEVEVLLPMSPRRGYASAAVAADAGRTALLRGPLVYCFEGADNVEPVERAALPAGAELTATPLEDPALGRVVAIEAPGVAAVVDGGDRLYSGSPARSEPAPLRAIPYHAWDNRAPGSMAVWLRDAPQADQAGQKPWASR